MIDVLHEEAGVFVIDQREEVCGNPKSEGCPPFPSGLHPHQKEAEEIVADDDPEKNWQRYNSSPGIKQEAGKQQGTIAQTASSQLVEHQRNGQEEKRKNSELKGMAISRVWSMAARSPLRSYPWAVVEVIKKILHFSGVNLP